MNAERHPPATAAAAATAPTVSLQLDALFEEYRSLYGLVTFRMSALDRRMPVTAGAITAVLGGLISLCEAVRLGRYRYAGGADLVFGDDASE